MKLAMKPILDKPHFVLLAGLHGNDFSQPEVGLQLAERLLQGYDTNADLQWIVDNIELDLILLANPDGRQVAEGQAATILNPMMSHSLRTRTMSIWKRIFVFRLKDPLKDAVPSHLNLKPRQ